MVSVSMPLTFRYTGRVMVTIVVIMMFILCSEKKQRHGGGFWHLEVVVGMGE